MEKRSPLNKGRTTARNRRKQEKGALNRETRAGLHKAKVQTSDPNKVASIQSEIDRLSA